MAVMILKLVTLGCLILSTLVLATPIICLHGLVLYKYIEKNLTCGGKDHTHGIVLTRPSHIGQENS